MPPILCDTSDMGEISEAWLYVMHTYVKHMCVYAGW